MRLYFFGTNKVCFILFLILSHFALGPFHLPTRRSRHLQVLYRQFPHMAEYFWNQLHQTDRQQTDGTLSGTLVRIQVLFFFTPSLIALISNTHLFPLHVIPPRRWTWQSSLEISLICIPLYHRIVFASLIFPYAPLARKACTDCCRDTRCYFDPRPPAATVFYSCFSPRFSSEIKGRTSRLCPARRHRSWCYRSTRCVSAWLPCSYHFLSSLPPLLATLQSL